MRGAFLLLAVFGAAVFGAAALAAPALGADALGADVPAAAQPGDSLRASQAEPADSLLPGRAVARIACAQSPGSSYAAYLPSAYTTGRRWPILFCFDPSRRGTAPIELFREAAERRGWILASSNDFSSADSTGRSTDAMVALWNDAIARFPIDLARVYAVGFSGGGRIGWLLDYLTRDVPFAGLIEVGAGIPWPAWPPDWTPSDLAFYGLVGERDSNYDEMEHLLAQLDEKGIRARLVPFDGGHSWPPQAACAAAVDWMEIAAMSTRAAARDDSLVARLYARELALGEEAERADRPIEAYRTYQALVRDCGPLREVAAASAGMDRIRAEGRLDARLRRRADEAEQSVLAVSQALEVLRSFVDPEHREALASPVQLRKAMGIPDLVLRAGGKDPEAAAAARRVLEGIYVRISHEFAPPLLASAPARAERLFTVATYLKPESPDAWLRLARARSRAGWVKEGLEALARAIALGLEDTEGLATDPDLEALRADPRFAAVVGGETP